MMRRAKQSSTYSFTVPVCCQEAWQAGSDFYSTYILKGTALLTFENEKNVSISQYILVGVILFIT